MNKIFFKKIPVFYIFSFLLFNIFFLFNFTNLSSNTFHHYQEESDGIVRQTIVCQKQNGTNFMGGNMVLVRGVVGTANTISATTCPTDEATPYASQFGIQGRVGGQIIDILKVNINSFMLLLKIIASICTSLALTALLVFVRREFGHTASVTVFILLLFSQWIVLFAKSVYWQEFLLIGPFIASLFIYPYFAKNNRKIIIFYGIVSLMIILKSLAGYEYLSTIALSVVCVMIYFEAKKIPKINIDLLKVIIGRSLLILAASVVGFILALLIHFISLNNHYHDAKKTRSAIMARVVDRTVGGENKYLYDAMYNFKISAPIIYDEISHYKNLDQITTEAANNPGANATKIKLLSVLNYLLLPVLQIPIISTPLLGSIMGSFAFVGLAGIILAIQLLSRNIKTKNSDPKMFALALTTLLSLAAPLSWLVLSRGHAIVHPHINGILFYIPFLIFVYILIGMKLEYFMVSCFSHGKLQNNQTRTKKPR